MMFQVDGCLPRLPNGVPQNVHQPSDIRGEGPNENLCFDQHLEIREQVCNLRKFLQKNILWADVGQEDQNVIRQFPKYKNLSQDPDAGFLVWALEASRVELSKWKLQPTRRKLRRRD